MVTVVMPKNHTPSSSGYPDILLTGFHSFTMRKSKKGDNSAKYLQNFVKIISGHLHLGHNVHTKFHDPSSSGSPDILLTMALMG